MQGEGQAKSPWDEMPDLDALIAAASDLDTLCGAGLKEWSELLLELRAAGWTLQSSEPEQAEADRLRQIILTALEPLRGSKALSSTQHEFVRETLLGALLPSGDSTTEGGGGDG